MKSYNEIIKLIADEVKEEIGHVNWKEVSIRLGKNYGIVKTPNACRKSVIRANKIKMDLNYSHTYKSDGTQISERLITISEADSKDPKFLMIAHGFDPDKFELISANNNMWKTESKDKSLYNFQSKITVRPKTIEDLTPKDVRSVFEGFRATKRISMTKDVKDGKYALEIDLADVHIGALSWHEEVGEDNDYKITFSNMYRIIFEARRLIETYPIEKLYICFLGDFFHIDTEAKTTTKGTPVDFDSRPKKMLAKGYELILSIIDTLAIIPTEVYWVEGNHSRNLEFAVFNSLPYIYAEDKNIKFDVSPKIRKAFMYGSNLVGLHHGEINKNNKFNWLQVEYREWWGISKYAETHSGHIHHETVTGKGGIIERTNTTMKPIDKYEYNEGYVGTEKAVMAYLWDKEKGLKQIHFLK